MKKQILAFLFFLAYIFSNATSGYILYIQPYIDEQPTNGVTRSQLIQLINYSPKLKPFVLDIDAFDELLNKATCEGTEPFGSNTLAMELMLEEDSILYMKYLSEPVKGIVYRFENSDSKSVFYEPEIIWISEHSLYRGNEKLILGEELQEFLLPYLINTDLPANFVEGKLIDITVE